MERCKTDLWFLLTEILAYRWNPKAGGDGPFRGKGLTEELHRPVCRWWDSRRQRLGVGAWFGRGYHKTTLVVGSVIQDILIDPNVTLFYFHAVDELAELFVGEVSGQLRSNEKLRALDPVGMTDEGEPYNIFPPKSQKRWETRHEFTVKRDQTWVRFPTLYGRGAGAELTGYHASRGYLDDVIAEKTLKEGRVQEIGRWIQNTVVPVIDDGFLRITGTMWARLDSYYGDALDDNQWNTMVIPASVTEEHDFLEDPSRVDWTRDKIELDRNYKLDRPTYGPFYDRDIQSRRLKWLARSMGKEFPPQMMQDPEAETTKLWAAAECEHFIETLKIPKGFTVVLSDPAPKGVGGEDRRENLLELDEWAIAVVRFVAQGQRLTRILLDGAASREWDLDEGCRQIIRLMVRWGTPFCLIEEVGQTKGIFQARTRQLMRESREAVGFRFVPPKSTAGGKPERFAALASLAKSDEFVISRGCPEEFLIGDDKQKGFLPQMRAWPRIRHDDRGDAVSYCTDPALTPYLPALEKMSDPLLDEQEAWANMGQRRSRYCGV